jgi:quercetin dioxygenase-like cupin family protein
MSTKGADMSHPHHQRANTGPHHLMLGADVLSVLLTGSDSEDQLAMLHGTTAPGGGPGAHVDPWRESFYVLEGELTFELEREGRLERTIVQAGDAVTVPAGTGHAFTNASEREARFLVISCPAGLERFFADAGETVDDPEPPRIARPFDRDRLHAAFQTHGLRPFAPTAG